MSTPTRSATSSLAKDSRVIFGNQAGARLRVNGTPTATVITVDSTAELTGTTLYAVGTPGMVVVLSNATATNQGKTANISAVTGTTLTVDVDFSAILVTGDIIAVLPPLSTELFLNQGHTLNGTLQNDHTMGLTETFDTHNTSMGVDVGGDIPFFQILTSEGLMRLLAFAIGSYKTPSSGTHKYRPLQANDGTFANSEDASIYVQDGNGVLRQAFFGMFGTRLTLEYPENARSTGSISGLGNGITREVGGTGRVFPAGSNKWVRTNFTCDTGAGLTFRSAFVELGGAFGAGLTSATQTTVKNLTVTIERGAITDRTLGDAYIVKPEEDKFTLTVSGTRILQDDTLYEDANGGPNDAEPGSGSKTETRLLIKAISPQDATKTITIDIPRGVFSTETPRRQRGRIMEDFEFRMLATLDANGCVSTTTPPFEITLVNGISKNVLTAI